MNKITRSIALGASALAVAGGSTAVIATDAASAASRTQVLNISAAKSGNLMFSTKSLKAKAGKIEIKFTNNSPESHSFILDQGSKKVAGTPIFDHGTKTITVTLKKGTYTYFCSVPGHRQGGMQGTLKVS